MNKTIILCAFSLLTIACSRSNNQTGEILTTDSVPKPDSVVKNLPTKRNFTKSEIIDPTFDKELIFGVWTTSLDAPACDFEINENSYLICDYDGDGERIYQIDQDSIFLNNTDLIFKGKILKVTKDSLIIHWQENEHPEISLRWVSEE